MSENTRRPLTASTRTLGCLGNLPSVTSNQQPRVAEKTSIRTCRLHSPRDHGKGPRCARPRSLALVEVERSLQREKVGPAAL